MSPAKRSLKDTVKDPRIAHRPVRKKTKKKQPVFRLALALVLGFAGGFSLAKLIRF